MIGWLTKIVGGSAKDVVGAVGSVIDKLTTTDEERAAAKLELERILQQDRIQLEESLRIELSAKERVLVAELTQGDNYTKRARPTVVYAGLGMIFLNYVVAPLLSSDCVETVTKTPLPSSYLHFAPLSKHCPR